MMTFKQLEAVYWVVQEGGFSQAALKLHTTQSALSKRVQELELAFDTQLFDRSQRAPRLTEKGEEMFLVAKRFLEERDLAVERLIRPEVMARRLRIGVTETVAATWLPRLVQLIQLHYPRVEIEPSLDASAQLRDKLLAHDLDLAIIPDVFEDGRFEKTIVGKVCYAWMCKPGSWTAAKTVRLHELLKHRVITAGDRTGVGRFYLRWFNSVGAKPADSLITTNFLAILGMTMAGLGVSALPRDCLTPLVDAGLLQILKVSPSMPDLNYVAAYKAEQRSNLVASIVMLAKECCDFTRAFQVADFVQKG